MEPQILTVTRQFLKSDAMTVMLFHVIDPTRFLLPEGFWVQGYVQALYHRLTLWGFAGEFPEPNDDAGWERAKNAGFRFKVWLTRRDGRVRRMHEKRLLEERRIDERFSIQIANLGPMHPRDPLVHPSDRFNCRCSLAFKME